MDTAAAPSPTETAEAMVPAPTETVEATVPAPTETVDTTVPAPTETVEAPVPAPTETVEATVPAPTETVEAPVPAPAQTVEAPVPAPTETVEAPVFSVLSCLLHFTSRHVLYLAQRLTGSYPPYASLASLLRPLLASALLLSLATTPATAQCVFDFGEYVSGGQCQDCPAGKRALRLRAP